MPKTTSDRELVVSSDSSTKNDEEHRCSEAKIALELDNNGRCSLTARRRGGERGPRRVKSLTTEISQMSSMSRRELAFERLEAATASSTKDAQSVENPVATKTMNAFDLGKRDSKKSSLTTRKRADPLAISDHGTTGSKITSLTLRERGVYLSKSEHGTNGSRCLRRCPSSRRVQLSRSSDAVIGRMSRNLARKSLTNTEEEIDSTTTQEKVRQRTAQHRRLKSTSAEIDVMASMAQKTSSSIDIAADPHDPTISENNNVHAQSGVSPEAATNTAGGAPFGLLEYKDIIQKYQQKWDCASCLAVVNETRRTHALKSLQRDKDIDTEAQKHAEAMSQSNGNCVLRIGYMGHVICGTAVIEMHMAAMKQGSPCNTVKSNILNPDFQAMGVGVAKGTNDLLYVCELFHGKFTLCCADGP